MRHIPTILKYGHTRSPILESATIEVAGIRAFPFCSLGIVPEGSEGRQVFQGPLVPGPWGFATTHAMVIANDGMNAREREGNPEVIELGEPFTVEGLPGIWMFRKPRQFEGDGARLVAYEPAAVAAA